MQRSAHNSNDVTLLRI